MENCKVWWNGNLIDESEAKLSIYDDALMTASMPFEMMRTFNRNTFKLEEHLKRLSNSIKILEIPIPYSIDELYKAHEDLIQYHCREFPDEEEWRTLINVSRGILPIYQNFIGGGESNIIIACFPLRYVLKSKSWVYTQGVELIVPSQRAIPEYLLDPKIKSRSRQHYKMADLEVARQNKNACPLLLDPDGFIAESTGANIFLIKNEKLYTPEGRNCLRGISRQFIMDMCYVKGVECFEKNLTLYDALTTDEIFLTCTPYCMIPVRSVNGHYLPKCVGNMTRYFMDTWIRDVKCDFVRQAERFDNVLNA